jgi:hypothetical protein
MPHGLPLRAGIFAKPPSLAVYLFQAAMSRLKQAAKIFQVLRSEAFLEIFEFWENNLMIPSQNFSFGTAAAVNKLRLGP